MCIWERWEDAIQMMDLWAMLLGCPSRDSGSDLSSNLPDQLQLSDIEPGWVWGGTLAGVLL